MLLASGIYCILNRVTGEAYVGQAVDIPRRKEQHFTALRCGKHHAKRLQTSFDQYGQKAFAFNVLERCPPTELDAKEHEWMLRVRPAFNACVPDYAAVAKGQPPDGRLRRRNDPVNREPSRYICQCGRLKSLGSRGCLACLKALSSKMVADGYLPSGHRFEWKAPAPKSPIKRLPADSAVRPRSDFFPSHEPNRPTKAWPQIKAGLDARIRERDEGRIPTYDA